MFQAAFTYHCDDIDMSGVTGPGQACAYCGDCGATEDDAIQSLGNVLTCALCLMSWHGTCVQALAGGVVEVAPGCPGPDPIAPGMLHRAFWIRDGPGRCPFCIHL
jgi:hypothetical protein